MSFTIPLSIFIPLILSSIVFILVDYPSLHNPTVPPYTLLLLPRHADVCTHHLYPFLSLIEGYSLATKEDGYHSITFLKERGT